MKLDVGGGAAENVETKTRSSFEQAIKDFHFILSYLNTKFLSAINYKYKFLTKLN